MPVRTLVCHAVALLAATAAAPAFAADFGTVTGQFILKGDPPKAQVAISKGDKTVKDAAVCAADTVYKNDLVVDSESKGIANIFIYIFPRDAKNLPVHPDNKASKEKEVVFDQKGCVFLPHAMVVRTDQTVIVKSDDAVAHNTHTYTLKNNPVNFLIAPNDREGIPIEVTQAESLPMPVKCDIHPWMRAYWLIIDHPWAAVTDKDGKFTIENLPAGEHEFRVWHERAGYLDRKYKVKVEPGKSIALEPVEVPFEKVSKSVD